MCVILLKVYDSLHLIFFSFLFDYCQGARSRLSIIIIVIKHVAI